MELHKEDLSPENFTSGYRQIVTIAEIPIEVITELHNQLAGTSVNFSSKIFKPEFVKSLIKKHRFELSVNQLAKRTGYSERSIRRFIYEINQTEETKK
ncbi:hypothetical protein [Isobaculum melis]|uniref:Mor transcription activator family protein n=1 Tax=Isobaculum melis TaxID=142588 RepID=A0A1H9Q2F0_9LACT|nr:hypothetical protein [Isobaculum melis]SER54594.1 hypothetical protein SAMN04488559_101305 [Isobaculum melis]